MIKNFITDFLPQLVIMVISLFKSRIMLECLGEQTLGLYQLFAQVIVYLALAEGGLSSAAAYRLYKPIADKDDEKVAKIVNATKRVFMVVALIIFTLGIAISFVIPFLIENNPFSIGYVAIHFILYVLSEVLFYLTIYRRVLFEARQEKYKINVITQTALIIKGLLEISILLLGGNLTSLLIMFIIINSITTLIILTYGAKQFSYLPKTKEADYSLLKDIKNLFIHKISSLVSNNIDVIIISKIIGLGSVVIYTTYNYITNSLKLIIDKLYASTLGGIGNLIATDKKASKNLFYEYNSLMFFVAIVLAVPLFYAIDGFIRIWYAGKVFSSTILSLLFVITFIYYTVRTPMLSFVTTAGLFKETNKCAILEVIINLSLSLILVQFWGIAGVLFATIVSLIISEYCIKPFIIHKKIFDTKTSEYYLRNMKFIVYFVVSFVVVAILKRFVVPNNIIQWFFISALVAIVNGIIALVYFLLVKELLFKDRIIQVLHFKRKEE